MITFHALPTQTVARIRRDRTDSYGNPVEVHLSDGKVHPCRHCLGHIPKGKEYLILAHRPFESDNAYAETGPIFLCADDCAQHAATPDLPEILLAPDFILRGYDAGERIIYGTGNVTPTEEITSYASTLLANPQVAFVDVRSARNNCFQCRIRRAEA